MMFTKLTDRQAKKFWKEIGKKKKKHYTTPAKAVRALKKTKPSSCRLGDHDTIQNYLKNL